MKSRSRLEKHEERLAASEALLRKSLLEVLPSVIENGGLMFVNSKYDSHDLRRHQRGGEAEFFLELALACLDLRKHLGLSLEGSVAQLYIEACEESSGSARHRRGPRKLAAALLQGLQ